MSWVYKAFLRGERYDNPNNGINILRRAGDELEIEATENLELLVDGKVFAKVEGEECVVFNPYVDGEKYKADDYNSVVYYYNLFYVNGYYN